ncbi:MAG: trigger factor [Oscillospiraceae bacterium]
MTVKNVEKLEKNQVALTVEVSAEEFEAAIERAYKKLRGKMNIPGFRPGKAPRAMIEKLYGAEIFYDEAVEQSFPAAYMQAIAEADVKAVGQPTVEMVEISKNGYTFKATVYVYPEVKLGQYKGLTAVKGEVKVTAEDVNARLQEMADRATRVTTVEREVQNGDIAVIDFEGFDNGVAFEGGKGENYDLEIGSGSFVPGFEEQLVGMKAGEEKDIDIVFPKDYTKDLAGKAVVFHVKVNEVKAKEVPEMDDEFAKDVSEFETLKELKADIKKQIAADRQEQVDRAFEDSLLEQVADGMECDVPQPMIDEQVEAMMQNFKMRMQSQGIPYDQYLKYTGATDEGIKAQAVGPAEKQVRMMLALEAVVKEENLDASDEEVEAEYAKVAGQYGMEVEQVKQYVQSYELRGQICRDKAIALIVDSAVAAAPEEKGEEKPKAKKSAKKAETAEGEEKPKARKTAKKAETAEGEEKPKAKKTTRKADAE